MSDWKISEGSLYVELGTQMGRCMKKVETHWDRESVKPSFGPGDSTASFEVGCMHLWRHYDTVFGGKPVFA